MSDITDDLIALAARAEAATGQQDDGGYKLDGDIARAMGWTYRCREETRAWGWCRPGTDTGFSSLPPSYTTSIDAAMQLVPEGAGDGVTELWRVEAWASNGVYPEHVRASAWVYGAARTYAATAALALTAASLRAQASLRARAAA